MPLNNQDFEQMRQMYEDRIEILEDKIQSLVDIVAEKNATIQELEEQRVKMLKTLQESR